MDKWNEKWYEYTLMKVIADYMDAEGIHIMVDYCMHCAHLGIVIIRRFSFFQGLLFIRFYLVKNYLTSTLRTAEKANSD